MKRYSIYINSKKIDNIIVDKSYSSSNALSEWLSFIDFEHVIVKKNENGNPYSKINNDIYEIKRF